MIVVSTRDGVTVRPLAPASQRAHTFPVRFLNIFVDYPLGQVHVPNFGGCQGRRTGVGVTTVSNSLILGWWVTKVLKNGDKK